MLGVRARRPGWQSNPYRECGCALCEQGGGRAASREEWGTPFFLGDQDLETAGAGVIRALRGRVSRGIVLLEGRKRADLGTERETDADTWAMQAAAGRVGSRAGEGGACR
ncbi:hypothetical protein GCM10018952_22760 [Streptosporangium vulgare]